MALGRMEDELAIVGKGHGMEDAVVGGGAFAVRGVESALVLDDGGRCGCIAGDALMEPGAEFMGLRVGETAWTAALCCGGGGCWCCGG